MKAKAPPLSAHSKFCALAMGYHFQIDIRVRLFG
jgi:hypothetical protein